MSFLTKLWNTVQNSVLGGGASGAPAYLGNEYVESPALSRLNTEGGKSVLLDVKYDSQRDNKIDPYVTCYPTSVAMVMRTLEQKLYGGKERYDYLREDSEDILIAKLVANRKAYQKINVKRLGKWTAKVFPRYIGGFWVWYVNNHCEGYKAKYKYFTRQGLKDFIAKYKMPVVTSTKLTSGGHIIVTKGFDNKGFYCNDPYGDARSYKKNKFKGEGVYYPDSWMKKSIGCVVIWHEGENVVV